MDAPALFLRRLSALGFEDDPFLDFYPPEYHCHLTGRMRVLPHQVRVVLPSIDAVIAQAIKEARESGVRMYAESELVREIHHFGENDSARNLSALDGIVVGKCREVASVKAYVHVEFLSGTVTREVRELLLDRNFYWVRTPASD